MKNISHIPRFNLIFSSKLFPKYRRFHYYQMKLIRGNSQAAMKVFIFSTFSGNNFQFLDIQKNHRFKVFPISIAIISPFSCPQTMFIIISKLLMTRHFPHKEYISSNNEWFENKIFPLHSQRTHIERKSFNICFNEILNIKLLSSALLLLCRLPILEIIERSNQNKYLDTITYRRNTHSSHTRTYGKHIIWNCCWGCIAPEQPQHQESVQLDSVAHAWFLVFTERLIVHGRHIHYFNDDVAHACIGMSIWIAIPKTAESKELWIAINRWMNELWKKKKIEDDANSSVHRNARSSAAAAT